MKRIFLTLAVALLAAWPVPARPAGATADRSPASSQQIDQIVRQLTEITGFRLRRAIRREVIGRDELKQFLEKRIREEVDPEEIRIEELILQKLGFVPAGFDLKETFIKLYTEQAAAFYDFRKKRLVLLDSGGASLQETALVHELAHALADQRFRLQKFLDDAGKNDDGALARLAVLEGQATWLMSEYQMRRAGKSLETSPEMVDIMVRMITNSGGEFPVLDNAPLYLRESLLFPYTGGMKFQQAVVEKMGQRAFTEVFRHPPGSTQQVLHPKKYFARVRHRAPKLPALRKKRSYRTIAKGMLGEFDYAVLLRQYAGDKEARRIAPRWQAGAYRLFEHKKNKRTVLEHVSSWDTPETARRFFDGYRKALRGKWTKMLVSKDGDGILSGSGDDGYFLLLVRDSDVYSIEGMSEPDGVHLPPPG